MSTRGELVVSKKVLGDNCDAEHSAVPGENITFELTVHNGTSEEQEVAIFDSIDVVTQESFAWAAFDRGVEGTTGSSNSGVDVIDETIVVPAGGTFVYTIIVGTKNPYCGTVSNVARWCTPDMKRPEYARSAVVFVGITPDEACLRHPSHDLNTALFEFLPQEGESSILFNWVEQGLSLVDFLEAIAHLVVDGDAKGFNPEYTGFAEQAAELAAIEAAEEAAATAAEEASAAAAAAGAAGDPAEPPADPAGP